MTRTVCPIDDCGATLGIVQGLDYWMIVMDDGSYLQVCPSHGATIVAGEAAEQQREYDERRRSAA